MKKITFLIFASLIAAGALTRVSFAEPYWQQSSSQSSTEISKDPDLPGVFDGIQVIWDSGSKFTTAPLALNGFTSGSWSVDQTNELSAFAHRSGGTTNYSDFFINFKSTSTPLVTNFYYGVFNDKALIQSQRFNFDGTNWSGEPVSQSTFQAKAAGVAPEPISSALFLLGGAIFGIKRLRGKK